MREPEVPADVFSQCMGLPRESGPVRRARTLAGEDGEISNGLEAFQSTVPIGPFQP